MATASVISQAFDISFQFKNETREAQCDRLLVANRDENKISQNNNFLFSGDVLIPLNYYLAGMERIDKIMFPYMVPRKVEEQLQDLQITYLLLLTQKKYEQQHQKIENAKIYDKQIEKCKKLIDELQLTQIAKKENTILAPERLHLSEDSAMKYLSMDFGQWLAMKIVETMDRKTKSIKDVVGTVNEKRLYWVWGSIIIKKAMDLTPNDFFNIDQAKQTILTPDLYTGTLSWGLYYFRFALNLGLLLKHTISGPSDIPWTERFQTQWAQRKFSLLNDSLWATCNIICFFWLYGSGALGAWGDTFTIGLLLFDLGAAVWEFGEQETKYKVEIANYEEKIQELEEITVPNKKELAKLTALKHAKKQCEKDWRHQQATLRAAILYAAGLACSYILLCTPFLPASSITTVVNVAGAIICFVSNVIYNSVKADLEVSKTQKGLEEAKQSYQEKINELLTLIRKNSDLDTQKKFLFLELKQLQAETDHQRQTVLLQNIHLIRSVLLESIIPTLIFVNLVFLPVSINLSVVAAIAFLAAASYTLIELTFKTEKKQLTAFDEKEYENFCNNILQNNKTSSLSKDVFFQPPAKEDKPGMTPRQNPSHK